MTIDQVNKILRAARGVKPAAKHATNTDLPTLLATMRGRVATMRETVAKADAAARVTFKAFPAQRASITTLQASLRKLGEKLKALDAAIGDIESMHSETDKRLTALEGK